MIIPVISEPAGAGFSILHPLGIKVLFPKTDMNIGIVEPCEVVSPWLMRLRAETLQDRLP
jgi:hypothetical protein